MAHLDGCRSINDNTLNPSGGNAGMLGPSGQFTFIVRNSSWHGYGGDFAIGAGQHCGIIGYNWGYPGSQCAAQYMFESTDFSAFTGSQLLQFGISGNAIDYTFN